MEDEEEMQSLGSETTMTDEEKMQYVAYRKAEALKIDPETAEVDWWHAPVGDPYNLKPRAPDGEEYCTGLDCIAIRYFARNPESVWVSFDDLPEATRKELWEREKRRIREEVENNRDLLLGGSARPKARSAE